MFGIKDRGVLQLFQVKIVLEKSIYYTQFFNKHVLESTLPTYTH